MSKVYLISWSGAEESESFFSFFETKALSSLQLAIEASQNQFEDFCELVDLDPKPLNWKRIQSENLWKAKFEHYTFVIRELEVNAT